MDSVRTPFARVGNKYHLRKILIGKIPPHNTYIEPFAGSGALFFFKPSATKSVLNDKDTRLMTAFRLLKQISPDVDKYNIQDSMAGIQNFVKSHQDTKENKFLKILYIMNNTFGSKGWGKIFKFSTHLNKLKNIAQYKEKLKNTTLLNQDYKKLLRQYNTRDAFWFLDPPYDGSVKNTLYTDAALDYEELNDMLKKIKGKFLLTINDSPKMRSIFRGWKLKKIQVVSNTHGNSYLGKDRNELLVSNY
tara:strand:+ start:535 stop:1275 length:741 start_codon:yes stop_codon:yes gene_type:complete